MSTNVYGMSTNVCGRVSKTCVSITSLSWVYHVPITSPTMGVYHVPIRCSPHQFVTRTSSAPVCADVLPEPVGTCRRRRSAGTSRQLSVTFCLDYIDTCRWLGTVGTERCGVLSGLTSAWERAACVMYAIMWCLGKSYSGLLPFCIHLS